MEGATTSRAGILEPQAGLQRFSLQRRRPSPDLAGYVERHWIVRWDLRGSPPFEQEILPHPCVNLVAEPGRVAVHGIPTARSAHRLEGAGAAVGTKFRQGGFSAFAGVPARALRGRAVALGALFGADGERLERELAACAGDPAAHIAAVEAFLRERLPPPDPAFALVKAVVADMLTAPERTTVAQLAARHGVSTRTLQRRFAQLVGVSPKWVLQRYRIHVAAERIAAGEVTDQAALALELGFADQAHFTRAFTTQVGRAPGAYARACAAARAA
ncbi:MAG: helix-turn-helix transcriptional regulator [Solirubrobacteraceae bacterium]|nr:helix-turn-helix transcriptional regulator [Solirubrobacteraceae bacterium]